jgi:preprotein translocase subunit SecB
MKISPLLLERHVFKRVEIVASQGPDKDATNLLNVTLSCARHQDEPNRFLIGLNLKITPDQHSGKTPAYTGEVSIEGHFRVSPEIPADQQQVLAVANGAGILFGAIREMVIGITARGPWPALMLTTLSFVDMAKQMAAESAATRLKESESETAHALKA